MALFIKICGITNPADALAAVDAGADALGFMFYRASKRFLEPASARSIIGQLPAGVARVGVFVNAPAEEVREIVGVTGIDTLQFHGEESPEFCAAFRPLRVWKAFRVADAESLRDLRRYPDTDAWLLDSHVAGTHGGTGRVFNWDLAVTAQREGRPVVLAGGLKPDNVAEAVARVRPYGIDVSSGVESAPGTKDPAAINTFIRNARKGVGSQY